MTKQTPQKIIELKQQGRKIAALTAYDYPMARFLDAAGVPLILVGDSLGMVVLGYEDTTSVTMEEMLHHVKAVARARPKAMLAADLPYRSYDSVETALENSRRLREAGAEAVKAEGGRDILPQVEAIIASGMPFLGHLGMLPQHVQEEGGYHIKGRIEAEANQIRRDALALQKAGAFAIVLELVEQKLAGELSRELSIPTIGIGSGSGCDGQILVTTDLLGTSPDFIPKHVKPPRLLREDMKNIIQKWIQELS